MMFERLLYDLEALLLSKSEYGKVDRVLFQEAMGTSMTDTIEVSGLFGFYF